MKNLDLKMKEILSEKISLHPVLIGILYILKVLTLNWQLNDLFNKIQFTFIIIIYCLLIIFLCRLTIKNKIKASLIASLFILISLYYKFLFDFVFGLDLVKISLDFLRINHAGSLFIPIFLFIFCFITFLVIMSRRKLNGLNLYLNVLAAIFLIYSLIEISLFKPYNIKLKNSDHNSEIIKSIAKEKPDIYYIILDAYTSSSSLKKYWNFVNSSFEDSLSQLGFFCTHSSRSFYDSTPYCLASYLNLSELKLNPTYSKNELWKQNDYNLTDLIKNNRLTGNLNKAGYSIINYSIFNIENSFNTDNVWNFRINQESLADLFQQSIWMVIYNKCESVFYEMDDQLSSNPNLKLFEILSSPAAIKCKSPIFVYAHFMMPHHPFIFDERGKVMNQEYRILYDNDHYISQLIYTNILVLKAVRNILKNRGNKTVIIIQGDHGYRHLKNVGDEIMVNESHSIFSSYLYPDEIKSGLNDSIEPSKALGLLFKKSF